MVWYGMVEKVGVGLKTQSVVEFFGGSSRLTQAPLRFQRSQSKGKQSKAKQRLGFLWCLFLLGYGTFHSIPFHSIPSLDPDSLTYLSTPPLLFRAPLHVTKPLPPISKPPAAPSTLTTPCRFAACPLPRDVTGYLNSIGPAMNRTNGTAETHNSTQRGERATADFLAKVRLRVLRGVRMVFSGVIPVSGSGASADPRQHRLWKMAESHGATVESGIGRHTTHVVAARLGTAKVGREVMMMVDARSEVEDVLVACVGCIVLYHSIDAVRRIMQVCLPCLPSGRWRSIEIGGVGVLGRVVSSRANADLTRGGDNEDFTYSTARPYAT